MPKEEVTKPVQLTCDTIGDLDGGIARILIDKELLRAVNDLEDRGEEDKLPRDVTIKLRVYQKDGIVAVKYAVDAKLPPRSGNATAAKMRAAKGGWGLQFQPSNPDNAEQGTFATDEDEQTPPNEE